MSCLITSVMSVTFEVMGMSSHKYYLGQSLNYRVLPQMAQTSPPGASAFRKTEWGNTAVPSCADHPFVTLDL